MTRKRTPALLCAFTMLALCVAAQAAGQSIEGAYTDYNAKACPHRPGRDPEDAGEWRCKGLNGIAVLVSAVDERMTMSFGPRAKDEPAVGQTLQGFNDVYKARIEWRLMRETRGRGSPSPPSSAGTRSTSTSVTRPTRP
jgi:hypothetical protein